MRTVGLVLAALSAAACGGGGSTSWAFRSGSFGDRTGGIIIVVQKTDTQVLPSAFEIDEPVPWPDPPPPRDEAALDLAREHDPHRLPVDAITTPRGVAILYADPPELLLPDVAAPAPAPEGTHRLLLAGEVPLRLLLLLPDGRAAPATLVEAGAR